MTNASTATAKATDTHPGQLASEVAARLARSRFFTVSLLIHAIILSLIGGIVLVRPMQDDSGTFPNVGTGEAFVGESETVDAPVAPAPDPAAAIAEAVITPPSLPAPNAIDAITAISPMTITSTLPMPVTAQMASGSPGLPGQTGKPGTGKAGLPSLAPGKKRSSMKIFNMKTDASNVVFVVDISGSMVTGKKTEKDYEGLEKEVAKAIRALDPNTAFGVIAFSGKPYSFKEELVLAIPNNVTAAVKWLREQGPYDDWAKRGEKHRGTAAAAALGVALKLNPDTIFFASDGEPTDLKGDKFFAKINSLQAELAQKAKIFTISYKAGGEGEFMKQLAKEHGGEFKEVR